jgi:membrane fusion protein (multidrug efflux system)
MSKKLIIIAGLVVVVGALVGIKVLQIRTLIATAAGYVPPPEPVTTAVVQAQSWAPAVDAVGSVNAVQGVTVAAELDGNVAKIAFEAGQEVRAGDLLVQQDIGAEEAQLRAAEAAVELARITLERSRDLLASKTISQSQYDSDNASWKQAVAQADNIRATIAKKTIRAPFSGRLGIRLVNLGQTLKAGDSIVSLQALDPVYVDFSVPQQELARIRTGQPVQITGDAIPGRTVTGQVTAINPEVDSATRNVVIEATVANADESLRPGMYVDARVLLPAGQPVLVIPASSVLYAPYGDSVFVVEQQKDAKTGEATAVARQQFVRLGETRGDFVEVTSGVREGDVIVSTGAFKLHNGGTVVVSNALAPDAKLAPKPTDS